MCIVKSVLKGENVLKAVRTLCALFGQERVIWCRQQASWTTSCFNSRYEQRQRPRRSQSKSATPPFCHLLCVNVCVLRDPFVLSHKSITEISCRISSFFYSSPLSCITWSHAVMLYIDFYCMHHWSSITKEWYVCLYHESQGGNTWGRRIKSSWYLLQIKWRYVAARTRGENNQLSCGDSFLPSSFN